MPCGVPALGKRRAVKQVPDVLPHEYKLVRVADVHPHPDNARRGDVDLIEQSIEKTGFYGALVVQRSTGAILVGNHRWLAAKQSGLKQVPAILVECDDVTAKKILITDNRTAELASWDDERLLEVLTSLNDTESLLGSGFQPEDIPILYNAIHASDTLAPMPQEEFEQVSSGAMTLTIAGLDNSDITAFREVPGESDAERLRALLAQVE